MSEEKDVVKCTECAGECGLVCECKDCNCKPKLDKETAALVAEFSHRELGN